MMAIKISGNSKLKNYNPINTFVSENYMKDSFIDMIWNKYRGRKGDKIEPKSVPDSISEIQEREEWIHQNIKEEFYLLKIIFIYYSSGKDCDKKRFIEMFEAFGNQNFAGSYIDFEKQVTIRSINEKIEEFAWMIVDISILILLSCLKLNKSSFAENIFKEKKDELDKLFTKHKQNQFLGPLTYLYYKITNQQSDVSPESIMEIDKRPLFAKCDKYSLSKFRTTIIYWVQCLSQKIVKKNENYEFLLQVAGKCLNETEKIDKFWKNELGLEELYNFVKDEFFISIEKSFNNSTPGYLEFLLKLLGNKHHNHINNVMNELFELKGRFWDRLAAYWTESLHNPRNKQKVFEYLYVPIKLICKILIYDNSFADVITNLLTNTQDKIIQGYHTISLLLVRSLHTFQGQEKVPFDTIAIIYKTLGALQSNLACSANVASLIQLYPRVIMADYQGNDYPSSILQQTLNLEGNLHPLLEIFNLFRKMDNTLKNTENKNKIYLAILKLTYEIILNNENIFDQYPSEKYAKEKYEILAVENETQEIVNLIYDISNSTTWSRKPLENLRERLKYRDGPIKFYSAYSFMEDLLKIVYNIILDTYDKTISTEKTVHKKWKIGNLIFKISDLLLRKYLVNLERFHVSQVRTDNTLLQKITQYLNGSKLTEMIVKTMEVVESDEKDSENPLGLDNKIWYTYIAKGDLRLSKKEHFRQMLASVRSL